MTKLSRSQLKKGFVGLDITVKSSREFRFLAPTWTMVKRYKNKEINEKEYTAMYFKILDNVKDEDWNKILSLEEANLGCYCRDEWFCHTYLVMDYMEKKFPGNVSKSKLSKEKLAEPVKCEHSPAKHEQTYLF